MLLLITHQNVFEYSEPVTESHVELRLTPLTDMSQHLLQHRQRCVPACRIRQYVDGLGNTVSYLNYLEAHTRLEVVFESLIQTFPVQFRGLPVAPEERGTSREEVMLHDFLQNTPLTMPSSLFREFAAPLEHLRGRAPLEAAEAVKACIYEGFRYDGDVTSVSSSIADILAHRAGVCQDFAHLMLATCRHLGFAARYVSGYTLPEQPDDTAAASHAWCEVFDPDRGWFGVDPTHNLWVDENHVRLGVGRDYRDVPPNRGVYRGGGAEELRVTVQLRPLAPEELDITTRVDQRAIRQATPSTRQSRPAAPPSIVQQSLIIQQQQQQQQQQ